MASKLQTRIDELESELRETKIENRSLRRRVVELEGELEYQNAGRLLASSERSIFHRPECKWAKFVENSGHLIEFSSHQEAVQAGYKPCKTCRA